MNNTDIMILNEFKLKRNHFLLLESTANKIINEIITKNGYFVMDVSHRTKEVDSLAGKIKRKSGKYTHLSDITDLCGIRIICYFSDTVTKIANSLRERFNFDEANSIDKSTSLLDTQFGYLSYHCICSLKKSEEYPEEIWNIPFEVQIRTVLQHAWAEIEHDLGYKSSFGVPRAIRRDFSRVAGILELADKEFINIRECSIEYNTRIKKKIASGNADDILLDNASLKEYLHNGNEMLKICNLLKENLNIDVELVDPDEFEKQFIWLEINTIGDLERAMLSSADYIIEKLRALSDSYELDIVSSTIIFRYLCEHIIITGSYSKNQAKKFYSLTINDSDKINKKVSQLID